MIKNIDLDSLIYGSFRVNKRPNYAILRRKLNRRFPMDRTAELLDSINDPFVSLFCLVMKRNQKDKYLENLYSNLSNSLIIKNKLLQKLFLSQNNYGEHFISRFNSVLILGNEDELIKNDASLTPYHELFHLTTTRIEDNDVVRIGFQYDDFAKSLNEGYTELMTKRYFGSSDDKDFDAYPHFTWFAQMIEEIIGRDKMEDLYLSSNIEGLILELEKYYPRKKIIELFKAMDRLFNKEEELFEYQKQIIEKKQKVDEEKIEKFYSINSAYRNLICMNIKTINQNKEMKLGIKNNFEKKHDIMKIRYNNEDEVYLGYYKEEARKYSKVLGEKNGV